MSSRLAPAHYEPARVPAEVRRHAGRPATLGVGAPGKVGLLELDFEQAGGRTELVGHYQKSPLQIMRPLYFDPARPDLAITYLMSTGGGIVQADRLRLDLRCGAGTAVHLSTQAATRIHSMTTDYATQQVHLSAGEGAYVEYLPEPVIPFRESRFYQRTVISADPSATVLAWETVLAGRLAHGERNAYRVFAADLEWRRPDGRLLALDTVRLTPAAGPDGVEGPAVLGGHDLVATLYAVTPLAPAAEVAEVLHRALAGSGLLYGVSVLPEEAGAWVRLLGGDSPTVGAALHHAWDAVRRLLIGVPAPAVRKS
ncbi:urease accessory protein UreD [Kitasatospora sp. NBC_01250]|uniref:urease accessory protein UreD n=1 Tax=unclassified Kitasatospora TaxID=2633591 RepID=UPI002E154D15|nr:MULTISPECIES: urease accessory protein UreD [unclassified Kitasatospora]WSJ65911.1 urease accessory protein UreD [Kitasatospora sp. NBC_01302]